MSQKIINVGNAPDDGAGDPLRTSMQKVNDNFTEFYTAITPTGKNVGIGTSTPDSRLTVVADTVGNAVRITQTGTGNALVVEDSTNPDATSFVINSDGNVGIGKNVPIYPLDINGDINTSGKLRFNSGTKYIGFENGVYNLPAADLTINGSKAITVSNFNLYAPTLSGAGAYGLWDITVADATYSTGSRSNTFTIGTGSTFVANGNFGINKTSPQAKLHVGGNAIVNNNLTVNGSIIAGFSTSADVGVYGISNSWYGVQGQSNTNNGVVGISNSAYGVFGQSNITSGGYFISNTGIAVEGVSNSNFGVYGSSNTTVGVAGYSNSWVGVWGYSNVSYGVYAQSNSGPPLWVGNGAVEFVSVAANGNLGIANSIPAHKLSVNGPSYFGAALQLNGALRVGTGTGSTGTAGQVLTSSGATGAPTWITIPTSGGGGGGGDTIVNNLSEGDGQIHSQLFTSSSTWTVPHGVARVKVYVIGGGAGGGGGYDDGDNPISGSPGGSGGFAVGEYDIIPGDVYTITVGQGGHANNFSGGSGYTGQYAGASGGTSSFTLSGGSTLISATGGTGTALGSSTIVQGTGSGGTLRNSSFINNGAGGSFNNQTDFPVNFASGIFNGGHRNASLDSSVSERTSWTISSEAAPGIGGLATTGSARAQGGVDGIVYLEWVEAAKGFQTANVQTFDTSGTWHKPDGLDGSSFVLVQMWGGGAGGIIHGLGGGGGGYTSAWYSLSELNSTETVTVGHGGAGGYNGSGSISTYNGGDTNFKNGYAYGGTTGDWNLNTLGFGGGGAFSGGTGGGFATEAGGFSENGGTSIYGGGGGAGVNEYGSYNGTGGSSMFGGAGGSGSSGNGTVPGGGGAGQTGSGAHGRVIVTIFGASTSSGGGNGFTTIPDTVTFTTTGSHSFVVPANVSKVKVTVVGGGGGAASTYYSPGSAYFAGGGGGTAIKVIKNLVPGTSIPIVVGAAGLTNTLPGGGTSSFGTYCSATGGTCGYGGGAPSFAGGGGIGINGDINLSGTPGTPALGISGLSGSDNPTYTPISDGIPGTSYLGLSYGGGGTNGIPATSGIVIVEY